MREYRFTIDKIEDNAITEEILSTWSAKEAIECAEQLEDEGIEYTITAELFINEYISGTECYDLTDLHYIFGED